MNSPIPSLEDAFRWTLGSSIRVSVLIMLVVLAQKVLARRLTSGLRYLLSILVLIGLLMPVAPPSTLSLANFLIAAPHMSTHLMPVASPGPATEPLHQNMLKGTPTSSTSSSSVVSQTAAVIWVSGASVLLMVAAWRYRKWTRLIRNGRLITNQDLLDLLEESKRAMRVRRAVALIEVGRLSSPAVFGVWRIRLLLPELVLGQLSADELRMVFLHELAHVRRGDVLLNWVLMLVQFLHWFNPLVWLALHRLRADRELACDALVMQKIPRDQHVGYGHVLIKLMEAFSCEQPVFASALPVVSSQQEIKTRLRMIRNHRQASRLMRCGTLLLAAALGCAALTRATEKKSEATPEPIVVRIDRTGALYLGSEKAPVTAERLKEVLSSAMVKAPDTRLAIHADTKAPFGQIVRVMDVAKEAKVKTINAFSDGSATNNSQPSEGSSTKRPRSLEAAIESGATRLRSERVEMDTNRVQRIEVKQIGPQPGAELVRSNVTLKAGGLYDPMLVDADVRKLYATGVFYIIQVVTAPGENGLIVTYVVQGRPQLAEIRFTGNTKFSNADLLKNLSSKAGELFDERKAFRDQETIQTLYEKAGSKDVRVKYTYNIDAAAGRATVTFQIAKTTPLSDAQAAELAQKLLANRPTTQQVKQVFQTYQAQSEGQQRRPSLLEPDVLWKNMATSAA